MQLRIENLQEQDVESVVSLFCSIVDEVFDKEIDRCQFNDVYSVSKVKVRLNSTHCVYLTGKVDLEIVCFLFGWVAENTGNIYWVGVKKRYRRKKYGSMLVEKAIELFENNGCHEARVFTFQRIGLPLFEKLSFKDITFISKHYLGVNLIQMVKQLSAFDEEAQLKRIIITGEAGQGIKLMAHTLASILNRLGKNVTLHLKYDSRVRGGYITAELVFSNKTIESPFFKEADIVIQLSKGVQTSIKAKKVFREGEALKIGDREITEQVYSEHFQGPMFLNMFVLGKLLRFLGIAIGQINFNAEFPARFLNENIKAVNYGYSHRDWI